MEDYKPLSQLYKSINLGDVVTIRSWTVNVDYDTNKAVKEYHYTDCIYLGMFDKDDGLCYSLVEDNSYVSINKFTELLIHKEDSLFTNKYPVINVVRTFINYHVDFYYQHTIKQSSYSDGIVGTKVERIQFYNRNIFLFAHNIGVLEELVDILTNLYKAKFQERYHMSHTLNMFFDARFVRYVFSRHNYPTDEFKIVVYRV